MTQWNLQDWKAWAGSVRRESKGIYFHKLYSRIELNVTSSEGSEQKSHI